MSTQLRTASLGLMLVAAVLSFSGKGTDAAGKPVESTLVFDKR
jgi:hypothetical protein